MEQPILNDNQILKVAVVNHGVKFELIEFTQTYEIRETAILGMDSMEILKPQSLEYMITYLQTMFENGKSRKRSIN